jgi:hypothetical protein
MFGSLLCVRISVFALLIHAGALFLTIPIHKEVLITNHNCVPFPLSQSTMGFSFATEIHNGALFYLSQPTMGLSFAISILIDYTIFFIITCQLKSYIKFKSSNLKLFAAVTFWYFYIYIYIYINWNEAYMWRVSPFFRITKGNHNYSCIPDVVYEHCNIKIWRGLMVILYLFCYLYVGELLNYPKKKFPVKGFLEGE